MSIVTRTVLLTSTVAVIVVVVAVAVSYLLINAATLQQSRERLSRLTDITAAALDRGGLEIGSSSLLPRELERTLIAEQISGYIVDAGNVSPLGLSETEIQSLMGGAAVSTEGLTAAGPVLIEARKMSGDLALVLQLPIRVVGGSAQALLLRFGIALLLGLFISVPIGYWAAQRLTRPLRAARQAANQLATGSRDVLLLAEGPSEIADISEALNHLSAELAVSEGRQREFLLSISHELRTPLTAVRGYGEALADGVIPADAVARTGATLTAEATRLDRLVSDLLDLARLGAVNFQMTPLDTDLAELVREAGEVWADRCAKVGVEFRCDTPSDPLIAQLDPVRLRQVIDNLAENALRVSPEGSSIVLSVGSDGRSALLEVQDAGPGLTPEDIAVAFEPGVLHERYRGVRPVGTGLGLALVGRLATGLGGQASAGQALGGGARFMVRLPLVG
ncbi:MAG: HAMP domain-containing sensor histidine kinase [Actinomycetota bacterium]|nr:HAMP domain-containing sensor histidine kinase [Actinomycetota bacterium]